MSFQNALISLCVEIAENAALSVLGKVNHFLTLGMLPLCVQWKTTSAMNVMFPGGNSRPVCLGVTFS